ncbi:MAG: thiamine biosynthesis protein ApbE [Rhizobiaceae bacterium]
MTGPQIAMLPDGRRLHLNHGPIDLIVQAFGPPDECELAYRQAAGRFRTVLEELVAELPALRAQVQPGTRFAGPVARRMAAAVEPHASDFVTPMAAVAGSVADEMLAALVSGRALERAYVNNGGDSALFLTPGTEMRLGIGATGNEFGDRIVIDAASPVRGVATSGWRGRSFSLGIADAVTVLARTAAEADVAATLIANAVDLPGHTAIRRRSARELQPDTDLGDREVTVAVGRLTAAEAREALSKGLAVAEDFRRRGLIHAAALALNGEKMLVSDGQRQLVGEHA